MARIAGVNIPSGKKLKISLTYIYGIGNKKALEVCGKAVIDPEKRTFDLSEEAVIRLREVISSSFIVQGDLRSKISKDIQELISMKHYRGLRHMRGLPVRGQRTHTNARTRKGPAVAIAGKKKVTK